MHKILIFEKEPQKIGLSQLKEPEIVKKSEPSLRNKNVKLSDLMRRASSGVQANTNLENRSRVDS